MSFTGWQSVGVYGEAATDGILLATSAYNTTLEGSTSGIKRFTMSARDKYGVGYESCAMPVMKGELWSFSGAATVWFMGIGG